MPSYVVTGGRGIGYEFANQLSAIPENHVFVLVRNIKAVPKLQALEDERNNLLILQADLTDPLSLKRAAKVVGTITGGTLDVLINNAAWMPEGERAFKGLYQMSEECLETDLVNDLNVAFQVNVLGVIHTTNAFIPLLRAGKTKKVITLSSGLSDLSMILGGDLIAASAYGISKAGANIVNAKYAIEFKGEGFIFLAVSPGVVATDTDPGPRSEAHLAGLRMAREGMQRVYPNFATGQRLTPTESVNAMLPIIDTLRPEDSGEFLLDLRKRTRP